MQQCDLLVRVRTAGRRRMEKTSSVSMFFQDYEVGINPFTYKVGLTQIL